MKMNVLFSIFTVLCKFYNHHTTKGKSIKVPQNPMHNANLYELDFSNAVHELLKIIF